MFASQSLAQPTQTSTQTSTLAPTTTSTTTIAGLAEAEKYFTQRNYVLAQNTLKQLLFPKPKLKNAEDIARAHVLLAASQLALGNHSAKNRALELILKGDVVLQLDDAVKARIFELIRSRKLLGARHANNEKDNNGVEIPPWDAAEVLFHLIPMGVGQFRDHRNVSGTVYLALQLVLGTISVMKTFQYQDMVGLAEMTSDGLYICPPALGFEDCERLKAESNLYAALFWSSVIVGIGDSFVFRPSTTATKQTDATIPKISVLPQKHGFSAGLSWQY